MTLSALKDTIKFIVEAVSKDRLALGLHGLYFSFGTASEIFIENLSEPVVDYLKRGAVVHMAFIRGQQFVSNSGSMSEEHSVRLFFIRSHAADASTLQNMDYITEMSDLMHEFMSKARVKSETNLSQTQINALHKLQFSPVTNWAPFDYMQNLTCGVQVDFQITSTYCDI